MDKAVQCPKCKGSYFESEMKDHKCSGDVEFQTTLQDDQQSDDMELHRQIQTSRNIYTKDNPYPNTKKNK